MQAISPTGYAALYRNKARRVVESWDPEGHPQVVQGDRLVNAHTIEGFAGLTQCPRTRDVIPGGQWVQEWCLTQEKESPEAVWSIPVVAWIIRSDGEAEPVIPQDVWPEKDYKGQEIDWDNSGMSAVRTVPMTHPTMGWRPYLENSTPT
ncbi:hypothetical protein [Streptomyces longisporus]|uniref:Uncharacterized protein n=1 Tax=Streptomyces longisporus TaxID=1948 RepID=A0ABN3NJX0_STRLO